MIIHGFNSLPLVQPRIRLSSHFDAAGAALLSAAAAGNGQNPPAQTDGLLRASLPNTAKARAKASTTQIHLPGPLQQLLPPQLQQEAPSFFSQ
jgi:hypothetical protein